MRNIFLLSLLFVSSVVVAQNTTQKPAPKPDAAPAQTPLEIMADHLTEHFARKNALGNRWNDNDIARSALYDLIIMYPSNDSLLYALAVDYFGTQKYISAVLVAQEILNRDGKNVEARQLAATGFEALNINDKALENYESLYLQTSSTASLYKMAVLQYDLKKYLESKTNIDILLTKPDIETMHVMVTDSEKKQKEYSLKVALLNLKGLVAQQGGDKVAAKKAFEDALALAPDYPPARQNLTKLNAAK